MDQLDGDNPLKNMKIPDNMVPTTENLEKLKRWGLKHYRVNRQRVQELMGTATITTEPELEPRVEKLQQQLIKYKELHMVRGLFVYIIYLKYPIYPLRRLTPFVWENLSYVFSWAKSWQVDSMHWQQHKRKWEIFFKKWVWNRKIFKMNLLTMQKHKKHFSKMEQPLMPAWRKCHIFKVLHFSLQRI